MRYVAGLVGCLFAGLSTVAIAGDCPGSPGAIGTSRTLVVDPREHPRIGSMQYAETLPLADKEVVLTFDDGPLPAYTERVLATLAAECVKATFFMVGTMARAYPETVRQVYNAGHTVGTHSFGHPRYFATLPHDKALVEIDSGISAISAALGDSRALAPFFRFPGLGRTPESEAHLAQRGIMTWSVDAHGDDWVKQFTTTEIMGRLFGRLEAKGRGVLLLHDIQPATAILLPQILAELKRRGYRIVHVVPSGVDRPKTLAEPEAWAFSPKGRPHWPVVSRVEPASPALLVPSQLSFGFPEPLTEVLKLGDGDARAEYQQSKIAALFEAGARTAPVVWPAAELSPAEEGVLFAGPSAETLQTARMALRPTKVAGFSPRPAARRQLAQRPVRVAQAPPSIAGGVRGTLPEAGDMTAPGYPHRGGSPANPARQEASADAGALWARRLNWFH